MNVRKKSIIYVDGFNLYYGALKNTKWKWLNLEKLFNYLRPDDDIIKIKYFTALINNPPKKKQNDYISALLTLSNVEIILGKFKLKHVKCLIKKCNYKGNKFFKMPEEKRTDVNIALHMLNDINNEDVERMILVSGDSDLVPAIKMVKSIKPEIDIIVYVPANEEVRSYAVELRGSADKNKTLPNNLLSKAQFSHKIMNPSGGWIEKPDDW